ncbi:MAG: MATE family efflux transporter, partial [Planctomycetota bacterium]
MTPDGRLTTGRLAGLSMGKAIWVLSWPVLIESYLNSFVGLVDTTLAARISPEATDAIGAAAYFLWFIGLIGMALGVGATALIARSVGKGRLAVANAAVGQTVILAIALGMMVGTGLFVLSPSLAHLLHLEGEAAAAFSGYLRIVSAGVPLSALLFSGISCLRGAGDAMRPLWAMVVVNIVNMFLSWGLSGAPIAGVVAPGSPQFGLEGVAFGTVIA